MGLPMETSLFFNYGFLQTMFIDDWLDAQLLPEPLYTILDHLMETLNTKLAIRVTTVPPYFGSDIYDPARHVILILAQNYDSNYPIWTEKTSPEDHYLTQY